jgi:hypothetical protein
MNSRYQTRIFARQVKEDLLALSDADLLQVVLLWVNEERHGLSGVEGGEAVLSALGFTRRSEEFTLLSPGPLARNAPEAETPWITPSSQSLRGLLGAMDMALFVQSVLPLAFQALSGTYSAWGEGATFNAHLANHLRLLGKTHQGTR